MASCSSLVAVDRRVAAACAAAWVRDDWQKLAAGGIYRYLPLSAAGAILWGVFGPNAPHIMRDFSGCSEPKSAPKAPEKFWGYLPLCQVLPVGPICRGRNTKERETLTHSQERCT